MCWRIMTKLEFVFEHDIVRNWNEVETGVDCHVGASEGFKCQAVDLLEEGRPHRRAYRRAGGEYRQDASHLVGLDTLADHWPGRDGQGGVEGPDHAPQVETY